MEILVTYDVATDTAAGRKRLRKVAQVCQDYGQRVQKSVFECTVSQVNFEIMLNRLLDLINPEEDSLRIYRLREPKNRYVREYGIYQTINYQDPLVL